MVSPEYEESYSDRELNLESFQDLINKVKSENAENPRVKSIVITKLQEAYLWYLEFNNKEF